jgi:Zn-dependent protease
VLFSDPLQFLINALYLIPALLVGLIGHEFSHAAVAVARGDETPRLDGRLSLNPSHHLDPLGSIAVLLIGFGWAKPVRINPYRMRGRFDAALVAVAGPLTNLVLAVVFSIPVKLGINAGTFDAGWPPWRLLLVAFYLNVALAVLNILPIPPLDGYNFFSTLLRRQLGALFLWIDKNQQVIMLVFVLLLLLTGILRLIYLPVATLILRLPPFPVGS